MAPQKHSSASGNHLAGFGSGGKTNGLYQSPSAAMAAAKKPSLQHIQADHELFLQAFESESLLFSLHVSLISSRVRFKSEGSWTCMANLPAEGRTLAMEATYFCPS